MPNQMELPEQVPGAEASQFKLLGTRRFLPFFLTQFLGAFNDNLFRNAVVVSITFGASVAASKAALLSNAAQGLFILPFFLFSALSGQLADKYEKSRLIRQTRFAEVVLMCGGAIALYIGEIPILLGVIFMLGVLATIFGPLKYSLMPQHLRPSELVGGNALVDAGTFLAILIGTIAGGLLAPTSNSNAVAAVGSGSDAHLAAAVTMVAVAVVMYLCARRIPRAEATDPSLKVNFNPVTSTFEVIRFAARTRAIFLSLLGISWFWLVGALLLAQLPAYAKDVLGGDKTVYTLLLAAFSIGTALGSLACERLSGHKVEIGLVPLGSIGMTVCLLDLYFQHPGVHQAGAAVVPWTAFLGAGGWSVALDCALIGMFGGLFIVPLYALILSRSTESHRARIIACNNIMNAGFMVIAALLAILWLEVLHFTIPQLFILAAVLNALVAAYIYTLVPEFLMRFLSWIFVNIMYRIKVRGLEHIPETGPVLLVSNHVSFMDPLVIGGSIRRPVRFVMDHNIFNIPVLSFIFRTARAIPIAPAHEDPQALQKAFDQIDAELAAGEIVCIFPEGKLTRHGELNEFKKGVEKILERRPVPVVPMALRGLYGSFFSRREGKAPMSKAPRRFWSRIEVVVTAPVPGDDASATSLQKIVAGLRGEWQ
ncbi:MAG TPA: MFS transporter [Steroidobacteraceae bacterium]|jgi:1-acyl-sn-glycerol-3-phosphate acyltransferase|nr:MFS transporter [Steroidobacteraceae bacterium]